MSDVEQTPRPAVVRAPLPYWAEQVPVARFGGATLLLIVFNLILLWQYGVLASSVVIAIVTPIIIFLLPIAYLRLWFPLRIEHRRDAATGEEAVDVDNMPVDSTAGTLIEQLEQSRSAWCWWKPKLWPWSQLREVAGPRQIAVPRTIVDSKLVERLGAIEQPSHLLEPEPVMGSGLGLSRRTHYWLTAFLVMAAGTQFALGLWQSAVIAALGAVVYIVSVPRWRDTTRGLRMNEFKYVAGVGYVEDSQGRRWTCDNAIMLVQVKRRSEALFVSLIGEAGSMAITFLSADDPDFIALWQRWAHPNPRPALVEQAVETTRR